MYKFHNLFNGWQELIPFMMVTGPSRNSDKEPSGGIRIQRLLEAVIIAVVTSAVSTYATTQVLEVKISLLTEHINKIEERQDQIRRDLYQPRVP